MTPQELPSAAFSLIGVGLPCLSGVLSRACDLRLHLVAASCRARKRSLPRSASWCWIGVGLVMPEFDVSVHHSELPIHCRHVYVDTMSSTLLTGSTGQAHQQLLLGSGPCIRRLPMIRHSIHDWCCRPKSEPRPATTSATACAERNAWSCSHRCREREREKKKKGEFQVKGGPHSAWPCLILSQL